MHAALLLLALAIPVAEPDGRTSPLLKIAQERSAITSGEVMVRAKILVKEPAPEDAGVEWTIHYRFGPDGSYRLDRHWKDPKRADDPDHRDNASFDGSAYRMIDRKDNAIYPVREYRNKKPFFPHEVFDPRLFGLEPTSILIFHHANQAKFRKRLEDATVVQRGGDESSTYELLKYKNGVPAKCSYNRGGLPGLIELFDKDGGSSKVLEARIEYGSSRPGADRLPTRVEIKNYKGGKVTEHEMIGIEWLKINEPFDKSLCSWASMEPLAGCRLIVDGEDQILKGLFWDGKSFAPLNRTRAR